jgi:hypothetical protein
MPARSGHRRLPDPPAASGRHHQRCLAETVGNGRYIAVHGSEGVGCGWRGGLVHGEDPASSPASAAGTPLPAGNG